MKRRVVRDEMVISRDVTRPPHDNPTIASSQGLNEHFNAENMLQLKERNGL